MKKAQAGNALMIFWFIFLLILVGGGIVIGIGMFFGSEYDFRQVDADLLNIKINSCLQENPLDFSKTNSEIENEIFEKCKINEKLSEHGLFILIKNKTQEQILKIGSGDNTQCALADRNENFPRCENSTIILAKEKYFIFTGSNQKKEFGFS